MRDGENRQVNYIPRIDRKRTLLLWIYILIPLPRLVGETSTISLWSALATCILTQAHSPGQIDQPMHIYRQIYRRSTIGVGIRTKDQLKPSLIIAVAR